MCTKSDCHESPVSDREPLCQWVEWQIASWPFAVMVGAGLELRGGFEASSGDHGGRGGCSDCGAGKHLVQVSYGSSHRFACMYFVELDTISFERVNWCLGGSYSEMSVSWFRERVNGS